MSTVPNIGVLPKPILRKLNSSKKRWIHIKSGEEGPVKKHNSDASVGHSPPRGGERGATEGCNLTPIKGENAHGQTMGDAE